MIKDFIINDYRGLKNLTLNDLNKMVLVKKYVGLAECPDFGTPKVVSYDYLMNFEVIII